MPVIVTFVGTATAKVVTGNALNDSVVNRDTLAGTVATDVLELVSVTTAPAGGALPVSAAVPVEGLPPATLAGLTFTARRTAGVTSSEAVFVTPACVAEIVTAFVVETPKVVVVNDAPKVPASTVTVAGTVAAEVSELASDTTAPPAGKAPVKLTDELVIVAPPTTLAEIETPDRDAGVTASVAVFVIPAKVAEIVTFVEDATPVVVTVNAAVRDPAGTVTLAGTVAAGPEDVRVTTEPPAGALFRSRTVPVEGVPPTTLVGLSESSSSSALMTIEVDRVAVRPKRSVAVPEMDRVPGAVFAGMAIP